MISARERDNAEKAEEGVWGKSGNLNGVVGSENEMFETRLRGGKRARCVVPWGLPFLGHFLMREQQ